MFDALLGAVIMVMATTGLVLAVEMGQKAIMAAGRYPLNAAELSLLKQAQRADPESLQRLQVELDSLGRP